MDGDDPLPRMRAEIDQAVEAAGEVARLAHGFFDNYREAGFSEGQSLRLTIWHLDHVFKDGGEE